MTAKLLLGKDILNAYKEKIREDLHLLRSQCLQPSVTTLYDPAAAASSVYVRSQRSLFHELGITHQTIEIDKKKSQDDVEELIKKLNNDRRVTGICVLTPLPESIDTFHIISSIRPEKDIEGTHPYHLGRLMYEYHIPSPCAARAAVELLKAGAPNLKGLEISIIGHSAVVGKPIALFLLHSQTDAATPAICHIATRNIREHTQQADVIIVAVGKPNLIRGDMIKPGAIVIDIGINKLNGAIVGDVNFEEAKKVCSVITPVPGGVGPATNAMLLENIVACAKLQLLR